MSRKDFAIATSSETVDARVSTLIGAVAAAAAAGLAIALPTVALTIAADPRRVASMLALTLVLQLFSVPVYGRGGFGVSAIGILAMDVALENRPQDAGAQGVFGK